MFAPASDNDVLSTLTRLGFSIPTLFLVDVGVSGGIHQVWRRWGDRLNAIGIDVLVEEINRLRAAEQAPNVRYEAAKVIGGETGAATSNRTNYALHRSAAYMGTMALAASRKAAAQIDEQWFRKQWADTVLGDQQRHPTEANFSNVPTPLSDPFYGHYQRLFEQSLGVSTPHWSQECATLDQIVKRHGLTEVDLLKIDTDGYEHDILTGATDLTERCLAMEIEIQFHGPDNDGANVFSEIDRFLRRRGFSLAKLVPYTYARSALPRPFLYPDLPAQTHGGPIQWGDALYIRDPLLPGAAAMTARQTQILAAILDIYGLEDYAAEIVLAYPDAFPGVDGALLDALTRKIHGDSYSYSRVIKEFVDGVRTYRHA
jgi:hypothetical protein